MNEHNAKPLSEVVSKMYSAITDHDPARELLKLKAYKATLEARLNNAKKIIAVEKKYLNRVVDEELLSALSGSLQPLMMAAADAEVCSETLGAIAAAIGNAGIEDLPPGATTLETIRKDLNHDIVRRAAGMSPSTPLASVRKDARSQALAEVYGIITR